MARYEYGPSDSATRLVARETEENGEWSLLTNPRGRCQSAVGEWNRSGWSRSENGNRSGLVVDVVIIVCGGG